VGAAGSEARVGRQKYLPFEIALNVLLVVLKINLQLMS
jgi:hypothetical protein